ncbi:MAG: hypothetical protein AAF086_05240 [Planctomycetota bacterium]
MPTRYDLNQTQTQTHEHELGPDLLQSRQRPVSLRAKVFCGVLAGVIVMTVSSAFDRSYDVAEAAGAAQVKIAEAEAQAGVDRSSDMMRGVSGMASAKHDWVFEN